MIDLMLDGANPSTNFWEIHPIFKTIDIFKKLYKGDTSRLKNRSSKIMWGIAMVVHPRAPLYRLDDKYDLVARDIIKDAKFKWDDCKDYMDLFADLCLTQAEKSLVAWDKRLKNRDNFLDTQKYTLETMKDLDDSNGKTYKLYQDYFKIRKELEEDEIKRGKANKPKSLSDAGEI